MNQLKKQWHRILSVVVVMTIIFAGIPISAAADGNTLNLAFIGSLDIELQGDRFNPNDSTQIITVSGTEPLTIKGNGTVSG